MVANRSATVRGTSAFAALVAFEVAAVVLLHRLGELPWLQVPYRHLGPWLEGGAPEDVIAAVARVVALVIAWWLLATTALYVLARVSRVPAAVRAVEWVTLPAVRRVADQALALTLATSLVGGGANAALAGTAVAGRLAGTPVAGAGYQPHPAGPPETTTPGTAAPPPGYVPHPAGTVPPGPPPGDRARRRRAGRARRRRLLARGGRDEPGDAPLGRPGPHLSRRAGPPPPRPGTRRLSRPLTARSRGGQVRVVSTVHNRHGRSPDPGARCM